MMSNDEINDMIKAMSKDIEKKDKEIERHIRDKKELAGRLSNTLEQIKFKDKVINLMVKEITLPGKSIEIINLYNNVSPDKPIYDLVKEYFYKKAEENK